MHKYRTNTCGEINESFIGKKVKLSGWINSKRDHGGLVFVDLRDHYGVTQVVFSDDSLLAGISKETVVLIEGDVTKRDEDTINPKLDTGLIEVRANKIEVLGPCQQGLPFEIEETIGAVSSSRSFRVSSYEPIGVIMLIVFVSSSKNSTEYGISSEYLSPNFKV